MKFKSLNLKAKIYFVLYIIFVVFTFVGAGIVIYNEGKVDAGIAVIPSLFGLVFSNLFHQERRKNME